MSSGAIAFAYWSYGLAAICHLGLTAYLLPRQFRREGGGERDNMVGVMAVASALSLVWALSGLLAVSEIESTGAQHNPARLIDILMYAGWYAVPLALMYFSPGRTNLDLQLVRISGAVVVAGLAALGLLAIEATPAMIRSCGYVSLGMAVFGLFLLEQVYRNATVDSRWNIKPLVVGLGAAFMFDLYFHSNTLLFNRIDSTSYAVRGFAYALVVPLLAVSLLRSRARKLKVSISKDVVFHTATLVAAGAYLLLASAAGYYVRYRGGSWGEALQLALVFSSLVLLVLLALSRTAQAKMRVLVGKHFFSYRYDYREEWLRFTRTMTTNEAGLPLGQRVIRGLADLVESPAGSLWLHDPQRRCYAQSARWNMPETAATQPADEPLLKFIADKGWVVNLEEYRLRPGRYNGIQLPRWLLEAPNTWLVVPLKATAEPLGFVILATSRTPIDVNWEVNDLLKTAGSQAASYLAQMQATEALLEARKFEAFNKMSAFVVHDLKNIVSQLSLLVRNAEKHAGNPEFQADMLLTVSHSVARMKQLMLQLRDGATPISAVKGVGLAAVARRVHAAKARQFPGLRLDIRKELVTRGHEDRIERVIGHLVQNAIEATAPGGDVWIALDRESETAVVEVGDTGRGMTDEFVRKELFKPFRTTKDEGTGIGAYESYQYVKELGGDIVVESSLDRGSRFWVTLPLASVDASSALDEGTP